MLHPWGSERRYNSYVQYFRKTFGERLQKVSVDAGFTCPNRDGNLGEGGCIYCDNASFNPSYCDPSEPIAEQLRKGIEFHKVRYRRAKKYLAFFQPFSNTYAPLDKLKVIYQQALDYPGIVGLIISTRPDCIDEEKLAYFQELSKNYYIHIEYGIESCYDKTLEWIKRGHTFQQSMDAVRMTKAYGLRTGVHLILGLPTETREEILEEAGIVSELPIDTLKLHQLQIIKGTRLAEMYRENKDDFHLFSLEEYIELVIDFLERLTPNIVVERFVGEVPPKYIESFNWGHIRNEQIVQLIEKRLEERDTWQGKKF